MPSILRPGFAAAILLLLAVLTGMAQAQTWTGGWDTRWRGGGAVLDLEQEGNRVTGTYPLYGGRIEAEVRGRELHGRWIEGDRFGSILFVMAEDGTNFMGRFDTGEWWTGGRMAQAARRIPVDQATPRRAMRTFLTGFNRTRLRDEEAWGAALAVVDFGEEGARLRGGQKLARVRALADTVDLTTFRLWSIPGRSAEGEVVQVSLPRAGTDLALHLEFRRREGRWSIVMPALDDLAAQARALRAARPATEASGAHFALRSPRDVFLTLFDPEANESQRLAIFDLSALPESVREHEGRLAIEYLRQVLARIGPVLPQEVPDDPASAQVYLHFEHPLGRVAVARQGEPGPAARWAVTADSAASLRTLWTALEAMPTDPEAAQSLPDPTGYFAIRRWVGVTVPALLVPLGPVEAWQVVGTLLAILMGWLLGWLASWPAMQLFAWLAGVPRAGARGIRWPARLLAASTLWLSGSQWLGLPDLVEGALLGLFSITLAAAVAWGGWCVVDAIARRLTVVALRTITQVDEIMVSLLAGAAKAALVAGAGGYVGLTLHIPVAGLVAGPGGGGLASPFPRPERRRTESAAGSSLGAGRSIGAR
ncbi:MAG: hypothetical protein WCP77_17485, partial [Roseococcus sp.]